MNNLKLDLSSEKNVICDSLDAIDWAYSAGLNTKAIIKTSSPSLSLRKNTFRMDSKWDLSQMKQFRDGIGELSRTVFDSVKAIDGVSHEEALCVAIATVHFHKILFKASCLTIDDIDNPTLFIRVEGDGGPNGNNMNPPWERILKDNNKFNVITYQSRKEWDVLNTRKVSWYHRIRLAGIEGIIYRGFLKIQDFLPKKIYTKNVFIYRENELIIETASNLVLRGARIEKIKPERQSKLENTDSFISIKKRISSIIRNRVEDFVLPEIVDNCEQIFFEDLEKRVNLFFKSRAKWNSVIKRIQEEKGVLLTNYPSSLNGLAITSLCREREIPVISAQHGVTPEISQYHDEVEVGFEANASDCYLAYNNQSANIVQNSHFSRGKSFVAGISSRHLRMSKMLTIKDKKFPVVYISTNVYKGNLGFFIGSLTDYERSIKEKDLINKVFARLSYNVRYKTYPEDNRRYPDVDPVFDVINNSSNVDLFTDKIDMRYLMGKHRVLITSRATSTLGWTIMSKKPVVFINWKENSPLTSDALDFFEKGLFLFNDDDSDFHEKLLLFLSKPISEIERLWDLKEKDRIEMIDRFFSSYSSNAGKRAAKMIMSNFLT